jgi:hypothetical protein
VPLLSAETFHLGHGESGDANLGQGLAHVVQLERFDDGGDLLHTVFLAAVSLNLLV